MIYPTGLKNSQQGFTFWGVALNLLVLGAVLILVLRITPTYMEYLTVKDVLNRAVQEFDPELETRSDLKLRIGKLLRTSQIYDFTLDDVDIIRERDILVINANYERRFPIIWIIDGVMKFEDLVIETPPAGS
ncbi:conserved hypothetical protein [Luminiphilus syltensis NOR5-1B]|uniref:DUF4845 domain-containing protein n=1 Tax=Luminiphilus syltensis NOR5-1B TaxID=565045 RepID=B8KRG7_9GAMM|nr:DUF4845 domain-containing protein [Luminiphilus syltensis]EED36678.1 conserved hypothetical protein [Luminiphilus syltensis NOR5-1B]